jgi:hypothetical protein
VIHPRVEASSPADSITGPVSAAFAVDTTLMTILFGAGCPFE